MAQPAQLQGDVLGCAAASDFCCMCGQRRAAVANFHVRAAAAFFLVCSTAAVVLVCTVTGSFVTWKFG
jgi:IS5 family transposase